MAERTCAVDGCPNGGRLKRGWCPTHYARWMRTGNPGKAEIYEFGKPRPPKACTVEGCTRTYKARGLCRTHYSRWQKRGDPDAAEPVRKPLPGGFCKVDGCESAIFVMLRQLCKTHYHRWKETGTTELRPRQVQTADQRKASQQESIRRYRERKRAAGDLCSVEGCTKLVEARGWCSAHYRRFRLHGDPSRGGVVKHNGEVRRCKVNGCDDRVYARECCCRHYARLRQYGDPTAGGPLLKRTKRVSRSAPMEERFWVKVEKTDTCWLWSGALNSDGYGLFTVENGKPRRSAHRVSWELAGNRLLPGFEIDHRCRVRNCVRPDHLRQVTHAVNSAATRRSHCKKGHPFDKANTFTYRDHKGRTGRGCRRCYNAWRRKRRASKRVPRVDAALARAYRLAIANDPCRYCGGVAEHVEHFFPVGKGGRDYWWNLTRACGPCNRAKRDHCGTWFLLRLHPLGIINGSRAEQGVRPWNSPRTRSTSSPPKLSATAGLLSRH